MLSVDIVGEDNVTQQIIRRLISEYRRDMVVDRAFPVRGGQIEKFVTNYNLMTSPLILLTDLDQHACAPSLIKSWLKGDKLSDFLMFRVACDEAESWLMSDRKGFSKWLRVGVDLIPLPKKIDFKSEAIELAFPYKPSLYMMREIAPHSESAELKEAFTVREGAKKGQGYNSAIIPFIKDHWNIENAAQNSDSLKRAIKRLCEFRVE